MQACETSEEALVSDTSSRILEHLFDLLKHSGHVCVASDACPSLLSDSDVSSESFEELMLMQKPRNNDLLHIQVRT